MSAPLYIKQAQNSNVFTVLGSKTYYHRTQLKEMGGVYNKTSGWIFDEKKLEAVQRYIEDINGSKSEISSVDGAERSMISDLLDKTRITTIVSKEVTDECITYVFYDGSKVTVELEGVVVIATWSDDRMVIMRPGVIESEKIEPFPFIGTPDTVRWESTFEKFICYIIQTKCPLNTYYADKHFTYAYCDNETFDAAAEVLKLKIEE